MRGVAIIGVMCILVFLPLSAQAEEKNFGLGIKLGYHNFVRYSPTDDPNNNGVLEDGEIDNAVDSGAFDGFTVEADVEYRFFPNFILGGGVQWYGADVVVDALAENERVMGDIVMSVTNLTITPRFVLPLGRVSLYTGAGLGLYWRVVTTQFTIEDIKQKESTESSSQSDASIGYHAMLGAEIFIYDWIGLVLEDRFAFAHFKGQDPTTNLDDSDNGGNSAFLGTRFHF